MRVNGNMLSLVDDYLAHRRRMGFRFSDDKAGVMLRSFARHACEVGHKGPVTVELAVQWALRTKPGSSAIQRGRRLQLVRGFCRYRSIFDADTEIPLKGLLGPERWPRRAPHIYSDDEIAALVRAALEVRPTGGLRPRTYATMFGLLACTGLRVSEALVLLREDVDLQNGVLTIRETKAKKSRLVPMHSSTVEALRRYACFRDQHCVIRESDAFFLNEGGRGMTYTQIRLRFAHLRRKLNWVDRSSAQRPRIHDLRHTFTVQRLLLWYKQGVNVDQKIAALSTYLGHVNVTKTYWYLTAVPELLAIANSTFEDFCDLKMRSES
ncbi:MAG: tyrosine-type recombinase/integrase [Verrucomicrobia bacterium]|jgi:integrase|nr:tyrosine-type recombinase/integrase [Verrucomicrobiota bacterium]